MTTNSESQNINVDYEMKINDNNEMMKCYTIEKMTPDEIAANPVKFNPMIVCIVLFLFCLKCFSIGFDGFIIILFFVFYFSMYLGIKNTILTKWD